MIFFSAPAFAENATLINWEYAQALYEKNCLACHGKEGNSAAPNFPKLADQNPNYLRKELLDYQKKIRDNPIMTPIAQKLSENDIHLLIAYIGSFHISNGGVDPKLLNRGQKIYRAGDPKLQIPACAACHGSVGEGNDEAIYPALAGQNTFYITQQLSSFAQHNRTNDPKKIMQTISELLPLEDREAVASFINGLKDQ